MRIHLDNCDLNARTGPNVFAQRLTRQLLIMGHDVVTDTGKDADVSIVFIEPTGRPLARRVVQRLDGIWTKPHEFVRRNAPIKALYDRADAVVWQSSFDHTMITKHWGARYGWVIRNGIELPTQAQLDGTPRLAIRQDHDHIFVCSANWHPQKRLKANVELFFHLRDTQFPKAALIIMGANPDCWATHPSVFYAGSLTYEQCAQVYRNSDWMLHLAYADHSPNTVIEAIANGCPVVCSNVGGTKELVGGFGVVIDEDTFAFEPFDHDAPPSIDVSNVSLPSSTWGGTMVNVDIVNTAREYVALLESVV